jgi:hypothetical protein
VAADDTFVIRPNPGEALGHHPLRNSILAVGEPNAREAEHVVWDVIVVGTGICLLPAVAEHGAHLLTECRAVRLDADRTQVRQVICQHRSGMLALKAKVVVLAAGALVNPVLLLNSRSGDWPRGLEQVACWTISPSFPPRKPRAVPTQLARRIPCSHARVAPTSQRAGVSKRRR